MTCIAFYVCITVRDSIGCKTISQIMFSCYGIVYFNTCAFCVDIVGKSNN